jgi:EAL domain-containing protein (putative c-di-GMP-specific phosphodiesterase class I)
VLHEACRAARGWQRPGAPPVRITVNLSGRQLLQPSLPDEVAAVLAATGLDAGCLVLEVTESMLVNDPVVLDRLHALRALGVGLAIDDFGTGYSSLAYLQRFPVDTLKIDKSFVDGLGGTDGESPLAGAVVSIARSLRLRVVAEGVETVEQAQRLRALGCGLAQGYLFARPMPAEDLVRFLAEHRPR